MVDTKTTDTQTHELIPMGDERKRNEVKDRISPKGNSWEETLRRRSAAIKVYELHIVKENTSAAAALKVRSPAITATTKIQACY